MPCAAPGLTRVLSTLLMLSGILGAQNRYSRSRADEHREKAAFLTHFAELVDWPAEALSANNDALTIYAIGEDPFHGALDLNRLRLPPAPRLVALRFKSSAFIVVEVARPLFRVASRVTW